RKRPFTRRGNATSHTPPGSSTGPRGGWEADRPPARDRPPDGGPDGAGTAAAAPPPLTSTGRQPLRGWGMAQISLGESRWRMVRRVLRKKRFRNDAARTQTRHDQNHFDWLVVNGFFAKVADGWFTLTDKGKASADLGFYEV